MSKAFPRWSLLVSFAVLAGIIAGAILLQRPGLVIRSGTLLGKARPVIDFTLSDTQGQPFTKAALQGHWTVIFPGFTFCPDVCPTTLTTLKAVQAQLGADAPRVQFVMLSVDPERDTPEVLDRYVHAFSPDFVGVTGPAEVLDALGESIGYVYTKVPGATPETYTVDHSAAMILIGPDATLRGYFTPPYRVEALVADLQALVASTGKAS